MYADKKVPLKFHLAYAAWIALTFAWAVVMTVNK